MKLSFVIPAYNEEKYLGACLDSVIKNAGGKFFEIIVVDNGSTDRTKEVAMARAGVRVVHEARKGLTRARQRGLESASGDVIAYIDADSILPAGWFEKFQRIFNEVPNIVCLSGPYRYHDGPVWKRTILSSLWWLSAPITYRIVGYMVLGGNFVAKRQALIAMGGFDTRIEFFGEDTNIARRLNNHGKVVFRMDFFIGSSSRRFNSEGLIRTNTVYILNFLSEVFLHRPWTKKYQDIRS